MPERTIQINIEPGLHARPAALFVRNACKYDAKITVAKGEREVDGKSIMGLLTLAAKKGDTLRIKSEGRDAEEALGNLVSLVEEGLRSKRLTPGGNL